MSGIKKFTQYAIDENKIHDSYIDLSDKIYFKVNDLLNSLGYDIEEGTDVQNYLISLSEEMAKVVIDPKTTPPKSGTQLKMDI